MNKILWIVSLLLVASAQPLLAQKPKKTSGNPIFEGWYADPEAVVFGHRCWVFPTFSAEYENQLHFDAFSSKDLVKWKKHPNVLTSENVSWARMAMWAAAMAIV